MTEVNCIRIECSWNERGICSRAAILLNSDTNKMPYCINFKIGKAPDSRLADQEHE